MSNQALAMELHPTESILDGWVHSFGVYYPRRNAVEHQNSPWSKAVILAKRRHESVIEYFGAIVATHLEHLLEPWESYIITPVPGDPGREHNLFPELDRYMTEILADCIHAGLRDRHNVEVINMLVQVRPKVKRQHQCLNTTERIENVQGLYALRNGTFLDNNIVILVDDVITSGATMAECARVLRGNGAKEVIGVALARTVRLRQEDNLTGDLFTEGIQ